MRPTPVVLATLISLGFLLSGEAQAASLEISPVIVNLVPGQNATTIEVKNRGEAPAAVQARPYSWSQVGDDDNLTPTQDIIISPPIFTVPAGASQTVRLLLRGANETGGWERSYRLLLDEVPPANTENKQIKMALRVSLPVMIASVASTPPVLQWRTEHGPGGEIQLMAVNSGHAYEKVSAIDVMLPDGTHPKLILRGKNSYILAGAQRHWVMLGRVAGPLRLSVTTRAGKSEEILAAP
jgi:fimbrial chaperone protein